jgi:hypothetical protein
MGTYFPGKKAFIMTSSALKVSSKSFFIVLSSLSGHMRATLSPSFAGALLSCLVMVVSKSVILFKRNNVKLAFTRRKNPVLTKG